MINRIAIIAVLVFALLLPSCGKTRFAGTEQGDKTSYSVHFTELNTAKTHELLLDKNDTLKVEITHSRGNIKLSIKGKDGYEAYTGNKLKTCVFTVSVPEAGAYTVTAAGEKAEGSVKVWKVNDVGGYQKES